MVRKNHLRSVFHVVIVLVFGASPAWAAFDPWEPLVDDSWIYFGGEQDRLIMHTANGGDYEVGFDQAGGKGPRGMNALKFSYGGMDTGRLASMLLSDSFVVENTGDSRTFADVLVLVAIDAPALGADFSFSLGVQGETAYMFDTDQDFGFYDHSEYDTGRPSGLYSITTPTGEGVSYAFDSGMVSVFAGEGVDLGPFGSMTFDYAFENLPGRAVFSVYGFDSEIGWIYHTNRGVPEPADPTRLVSTFEVIPEPATFGLLCMGTVVVGWRRGRRWS